MSDPFKDIRDKRLSELNPEQRDRACELWLRQNHWSFGSYYSDRDDALFPSILRVVDRLRRDNDALRRTLTATGEVLEQAQNGLHWYQEQCPDLCDGSDDEMNHAMAYAVLQIEEALK